MNWPKYSAASRPATSWMDLRKISVSTMGMCFAKKLFAPSVMIGSNPSMSILGALTGRLSGMRRLSSVQMRTPPPSVAKTNVAPGFSGSWLLLRLPNASPEPTAGQHPPGCVNQVDRTTQMVNRGHVVHRPAEQGEVQEVQFPGGRWRKHGLERCRGTGSPGSLIAAQRPRCLVDEPLARLRHRRGQPAVPKSSILMLHSDTPSKDSQRVIVQQPYGNCRPALRSVAPVGCREEQHQRPIVIGRDVRTGPGAYIRGAAVLSRPLEVCARTKGCSETGCTVGAQAAVARSIPPHAVVAGRPARVVKHRFPGDALAALPQSKWWGYAFPDPAGPHVTDVPAALAHIEWLVANDAIKPYRPTRIQLVAPAYPGKDERPY